MRIHCVLLVVRVTRAYILTLLLAFVAPVGRQKNIPPGPLFDVSSRFDSDLAMKFYEVL